MAELLVRIRNHKYTNGEDALRRMRAGDIVSVCENNHPWTQKELDNPDWRIIKLPKITVNQVNRLIDRMTIEEESLYKSGVITFEYVANRTRAYRFNLAKLQEILQSATLRNQLNNNFTIQYALEQGIIEKVIN